MKNKYYLEVFLISNPFTDFKAKVAGMNAHQKNVFLSLTKVFVLGFGEDWDRKKYLEEYSLLGKTSIKFYSDDLDWLKKQKQTIEEEMFKAIMEDKYRSVRDKMRRLMPKKYRRSDSEIESFSKWEKFEMGIALFKITCLLDIYDEKTKNSVL